ncbi:MAG: HAD family hydrolase [Ruminococcus sp.]|nr:HAD family hydrolase [Ruminococcus sp.]
MNLFVSDLDGTLLDKNTQLSDYSKNILNNLMDNGMSFTIATARTIATVSNILDGLKLNIPVILLNGALIRDTQNDEYIFSAIIEKSVSDKVITLMHEFELYGFMYTIENDEMIPYYEKIATDEMRCFYEERKNKYYKRFYHTESFKLVNDKAVYFSLTNKYEKLLPLYEKIKDSDGIKLTFYRDVYNKGLWYLEIFSFYASKENAVNFLRAKYNFDRIICFGDNLNDIPLFNAGDKNFAVENACDELKALADGIIASNTENGVANFLKDNYGKDF